MVGKASAPTPVQASEPASIEQPIPVLPSLPELTSDVVAAPAQAALEPVQVPMEPAIFGVPERDKLYLQLGSLERGFAILMVHGARKLGYPAIVSNGTNPNVFRVLVGPFQKSEDYQTAKALFTSMGLDYFSRKYDEAPRSNEPAQP
jgi:cell division septation protein DedD